MHIATQFTLAHKNESICKPIMYGCASRGAGAMFTVTSQDCDFS